MVFKLELNTCLKLLWSSVYILNFLECMYGPLEKTNNWNLKQGNYRNDPCLMRKILPNSPQQLPNAWTYLWRIWKSQVLHIVKIGIARLVLCYNVCAPKDGMEWIGRRWKFCKSEVAMEKGWLNISLKKATLNEWYSHYSRFNMLHLHRCISQIQSWRLNNFGALRFEEPWMNIKGSSSRVVLTESLEDLHLGHIQIMIDSFQVTSNGFPCHLRCPSNKNIYP